MKIEFLKQSGKCRRLILVMAGWGTLPSLYSSIDMPGWDVAVGYGIDDDIPNFALLNRYRTIYIYAWSLGVYAAERFLPSDLPVCAAYAVNGTISPVDDCAGIPASIFTGTRDALDERSLRKFRMRMFDSIEDFKTLETTFSEEADIEKLRSQLTYVLDHPLRSPHISWTGAFVGNTDRIFPPDNQLFAWKTKNVDITEMSNPHYIDLQGIVKRTVVDVEKVGRRFTRSLHTYSVHAHAQRLIAGRLASEFIKDLPGKLHKVIEIGPGTGLFTHEWSKRCKAHNAVFIDVGEMPRYEVADSEVYIKDDAEAVIAEMASEEPESLDAVFSASAMQWFSNTAYFLECCARLLRKGGELVISTFAPGNLSELHGLRPDHLHYIPAYGLRDILNRYFSESEVVEDAVELDFSSPLEALRHLRLTGVTASGHKSGIGELRRFARNYPVNPRGRYSLTFRPIFLRAKK